MQSNAPKCKYVNQPLDLCMCNYFDLFKFQTVQDCMLGFCATSLKACLVPQCRSLTICSGAWRCLVSRSYFLTQVASTVPWKLHQPGQCRAKKSTPSASPVVLHASLESRLEILVEYFRDPRSQAEPLRYETGN